MAAQGTRPAVDYRGEATVMARMTQRTTRALAAAATSMALLFGAAACTTPSPEPTPTGPTATPTPTRPPIPYVARPSGLIWDSGSNGHDDQQNAAFAHMRGRPLDVLGVAPTRDSWDQLLDDWWLSGDTIPANFKGTLNVAVPLFPKDGSMGAAARGDYDEQWQILGRMIAKRYPTAYVRPGWEMNIHNWDWSANPDNVEQFKEAFRRASVALKKAGPKLRIVWNVNEGKGDSLPDATMAWPGDQYVDIVGMDAYDWHPPYDEKGWEEHRTKNQGWDFWGNFARQKGKKFAFPEWGVIAGNENSGGDNPKFIDYAYTWMEQNADIMAFETYFDEKADYCKCALSVNPASRAAYQQWMKKLVYPADQRTASSQPTS